MVCPPIQNRSRIAAKNNQRDVGFPDMAYRSSVASNGRNANGTPVKSRSLTGHYLPLSSPEERGLSTVFPSERMIRFALTTLELSRARKPLIVTWSPFLSE